MYKLAYLCFAFYFISLHVVAQEDILDQSVFAECALTVSPKECTHKKLRSEISSLFTSDVIVSLRTKNPENHIDISAAFVTDEKGAIEPYETEVICNNALLKEKITDYLNNLPALLPKNKSIDNGRCVYVLSYVFIFNEKTIDYYAADRLDLIAKDLKLPVFPNAAFATPLDSDIESESKDDLINYLKKFISEKYRIPRNKEGARQIKLEAIIHILKDGTSKVSKIIGGEEIFRKEYERVLKKIPKLKPESVKGIPVASSIKLPITITYN